MKGLLEAKEKPHYLCIEKLMCFSGMSMHQKWQIYCNKTALCSRVSLHVPVFLAADGPSPKAIKIANVRRIVLFVFFSFSL